MPIPPSLLDRPEAFFDAFLEVKWVFTECGGGRGGSNANPNQLISTSREVVQQKGEVRDGEEEVEMKRK